MSSTMALWDMVAPPDSSCCNRPKGQRRPGTVFGSVNRAKSVCQKLRNALIAVRLRGRHYRMNVQARKAKAAEEVPGHEC